MGTAGCSQAHLASTARLARERALLGGFCRRHGRPPARRIRWSAKEIFAEDRTKRIPGLGSQTMGGLSPSTAPRLMQLDPRSPVAVQGRLSWKIKLSHSWVPEWIGVSGRANQAQLAVQIQMPRNRQWACLWRCSQTNAGRVLAISIAGADHLTRRRAPSQNSNRHSVHRTRRRTA